MLFTVYSGSGVRETLLEHRYGPAAALDYVLALMSRDRPNIQIYNQGGDRVSLADLLALLDEEGE